MLLVFAIVSMLGAVTFYTIGVLSERKKNELKVQHVIIFWIGLIFDTTGTTIMGRMSEGFSLNLHGLTGLIALLLMMIHVFWATYVVVKGSQEQKKKFHKYSLFVWLFWLVPFFGGMIMNM